MLNNNRKFDLRVTINLHSTSRIYGGKKLKPLLLLARKRFRVENFSVKILRNRVRFIPNFGLL